LRINGSTVLITGASTGIGAATAREFAKYGAEVDLAARNGDALACVADEIIAAGGVARFHPADLSTVDGARGLAAAVDTPDILVNCAGAGRMIFAEETSPEEFASMAAVPYLAAGYITFTLLPAMIARGSGRIVNVNSPASRVVWPSAAGYASARWALRGLTEGLRADLRGTGVGVTEVIPGEVSSEYWRHNPGSAERLPSISKLLPTLTPDKVAAKLVRAAAVGRAEVVFPLLLRALTAQARLAPRLVAGVVAATGAKREIPKRA
jgi:short-subunit dehydrogenase